LYNHLIYDKYASVTREISYEEDGEVSLYLSAVEAGYGVSPFICGVFYKVPGTGIYAAINDYTASETSDGKSCYIHFKMKEEHKNADGICTYVVNYIKHIKNYDSK
jgi:hypothetical protein